MGNSTNARLRHDVETFVFVRVSWRELGLSAPSAATAQVYPQRPVKIITAGLPGTPFDLVARSLADQLSLNLKQTFLVETRPGAAGNVGAEFVAKAPADGYTLLSALGTTFTVNPSLYKKPPFDPLADFRFIAIMAATGNTLVVHPSIPVNSVAEFVAYAKKERISYAHGGNGSPGHLAMEYFRLMAGFQATPVPYRGNPQLVTDLVAGQIKFGFVGTSGVAQHVRAGSIERPGDGGPQSLADRAGAADDCGEWLSQIRIRRLPRVGGASGHSGTGCRTAGARSASHISYSRTSAEVPRAGHPHHTDAGC